MGCFLGCFGGGKKKKNRRRQRRRESFQPPRVNRISEGSIKDTHLKLSVPIVKEVPKVSKEVPSVEEVTEVSPIPINDIFEEKVEEKQSPSPTRKRVTFDSNVKTYEHIVVEEEIFEEEKPLNSTLARSSSEVSNITSVSSVSSYPANHRYQNCRESDDDEEEEEEEEGVTDCDESDLEDSGNDDDNYDWDEEVYTEEIADNVLDIESTEEKTSTSVRDRSGYVNAVLSPIENLTQWKALKSKGRTTTTTQRPTRKENNTNLVFDQEPKLNESKKQRTQEVAVDASLSTWLSTTTSECISETATSSYTKRVQSHDERPVLCALTADDIKQFSATNSPRKSPSRSPESPIIGTVGRYWNI